MLPNLTIPAKTAPKARHIPKTYNPSQSNKVARIEELEGVAGHLYLEGVEVRHYFSANRKMESQVTGGGKVVGLLLVLVEKCDRLIQQNV